MAIKFSNVKAYQQSIHWADLVCEVGTTPKWPDKDKSILASGIAIRPLSHRNGQCWVHSRLRKKMFVLDRMRHTLMFKTFDTLATSAESKV